MLQFLLLFLEPRSGCGLFLLFNSCQFPQRSAPLLFVVNLGFVGCFQLALELCLREGGGQRVLLAECNFIVGLIESIKTYITSYYSAHLQMTQTAQ